MPSHAPVPQQAMMTAVDPVMDWIDRGAGVSGADRMERNTAMTPNLTETPPSVDGGRLPADKISREFAGRLSAVPAHEWVRTIILPTVPETDTPLRGPARAAQVQAVRQATEAHFAEVDQVLEHCGGRRVSEHGNSLGFLVVDATPAAIHALCDLIWVRAVLEDQSIHPVG